MTATCPFDEPFVKREFPLVWEEDQTLQARSFWKTLRDRLPYGSGSAPVTFDAGKVLLSCDEDLDRLQIAARELHPWRKGPWQIGALDLDCEWRSDWKWNRIADSLNFKGKRVADVGCGNGYYMFRMLEQDPVYVLGLEPMLRFRMQFGWLHSFCGDPRLSMVPLGIEHLHAMPGAFDVVVCMGVLYHRPDPVASLRLLKDSLCPGGQLVLEGITLPEGTIPEVLHPSDRYASMRNVFTIPTPKKLAQWCDEAGFRDIAILSDELTTTEEQRQTDWMTFFSLEQFLCPEDPRRTLEGYPAPRRAVLTAVR